MIRLDTVAAVLERFPWAERPRYGPGRPGAGECVAGLLDAWDQAWAVIDAPEGDGMMDENAAELFQLYGRLRGAGVRFTPAFEVWARQIVRGWAGYGSDHGG